MDQTEYYLLRECFLIKKGLSRKFNPKRFNNRSRHYSNLGNCLVIGNDDQYYGLSGSGDDEPKVQIPDSSDGLKKL